MVKIMAFLKRNSRRPQDASEGLLGALEVSRRSQEAPGHQTAPGSFQEAPRRPQGAPEIPRKLPEYPRKPQEAPRFCFFVLNKNKNHMFFGNFFQKTTFCKGNSKRSSSRTGLVVFFIIALKWGFWDLLGLPGSLRKPPGASWGFPEGFWDSLGASRGFLGLPGAFWGSSDGAPSSQAGKLSK